MVEVPDAYSSMNVVDLRLLVEVSKIFPAVNHAGVHGDGLFEDSVDETFDSGLVHGVDTSFGEGQIYGLGKVQGGCGWIAEIYT